eukprot:9475757-Pyramimonas_sp.AAC.1
MYLPDVVVAEVQPLQHSVVPGLLVLGVERRRENLGARAAQEVVVEVQAHHGLVRDQAAVDRVAILAEEAVVGEVERLQGVVPRLRPTHRT